MKKLASQITLTLAILLLAAASQQVKAQSFLEWQGTATGQTANQNFRLPVTVRLYGKLGQYDSNPYNVVVAIGTNGSTAVELGAALQLSGVPNSNGMPLQFMKVRTEANNIIRATLFNTNTGQAGAANTFYPRNVSSQAWAWHGAIGALWEKVFQYNGGVETYYFTQNSQVAFQLLGSQAQEIVGFMDGVGASATATGPNVRYYASFQARRVR